MKLLFKQGLISEHLPKSLPEEVDFNGYLSLFDLNVPLIPRKILYSFNQEEGIRHFDRLRAIQYFVQQGKLDLQSVVAQLEKIPILDDIMPLLEVKGLDQYHLYQLGVFLREDRILSELERRGGFELEGWQYCEKIAGILSAAMKPDCSNLLLSENEQKLNRTIQEINEEIQQEIAAYEQEIFRQTGLKMIYPYLKEIPKDYHNISLIQQCSLLSVSDSVCVYQVSFILPAKVKELIDREKQLRDCFAVHTGKKLAGINQLLYSFYKDFSYYYQERQYRAYLYALSWVMIQRGLCLPEFQAEAGLVMKEGRLWGAADRLGNSQYIPLSISLKPGSNVLFGANMTGKTIVLKTLYFHLTLIRAGLPVPAANIRLRFPEYVDLHLKGSGDIRRNLSCFGEEVQFFCRPYKDGMYILADELFQSADPVSGAMLSEVMLDYYAETNSVFFCSSHYPEILNFPKRIPNIHLLRMRDGDMQENPYTVEPILPEDFPLLGAAMKSFRRSLEIALGFPLSDSIKERIRKKITEGVLYGSYTIK